VQNKGAFYLQWRATIGDAGKQLVPPPVLPLTSMRMSLLRATDHNLWGSFGLALPYLFFCGYLWCTNFSGAVTVFHQLD